jgi:hypothetical protein
MSTEEPVSTQAEPVGPGEGNTGPTYEEYAVTEEATEEESAPAPGEQHLPPGASPAGEASGGYLCQYCGSAFEVLGDLEAHLEARHSSG